MSDPTTTPPPGEQAPWTYPPPPKEQDLWSFTVPAVNWRNIALGAVLLVLAVVLLVAFFKDKKAPAPPQQSVAMHELFGCQFLVFQNPFFIIHFPQCNRHGASGPTNSVALTLPMPPRPPNMPAP